MAPRRECPRPGGVEFAFTGSDSISHAQNDFNGDGRSDILWRNDDGTVTDWVGTASGGFSSNSGNFQIQADPSWQIVGSGDFNGDGRFDLIWRTAAAPSPSGLVRRTAALWGIGPISSPVPIRVANRRRRRLQWRRPGRPHLAQQRRHRHRVAWSGERRLLKQLGLFQHQCRSELANRRRRRLQWRRPGRPHLAQ